VKHLTVLTVLNVFIGCFECVLCCEGFACFKCFFENVNQNENKLKKTSSVMVDITYFSLTSLL